MSELNSTGYAVLLVLTDESLRLLPQLVQLQAGPTLRLVPLRAVVRAAVLPPSAAAARAPSWRTSDYGRLQLECIRRMRDRAPRAAEARAPACIRMLRRGACTTRRSLRLQSPHSDAAGGYHYGMTMRTGGGNVHVTAGHFLLKFTTHSEFGGMTFLITLIGVFS